MSRIKFKAVIACLVIFSILFSTNLPVITLAQVNPDLVVELPGTVAPDLGVPAGPPPGRAASDQDEVPVVVVLAPRNEAAFKALAEGVSDPASPRYNQPITEAEYRLSFAPDSKDIGDLKKYFAAQGLSLNYESPSGLVLSFKGTSAQRDKAFGTRSEYRAAASGEVGLINVAPLKLPASLSKNIKGVLGFDQLHNAKTHSVKVKPGISKNSVSQNTPASLRATYNFPSTLNGSGVNAGIVLWGAPDLNDTNRWKSANGIPGTVSLVAAEPASNLSPASEDGLRFEANMDVQLTLTAAPNASVRFYVAKGKDFGSLATALQKAVDDNVSTLSNSWGTCEQTMSSSTIQAYGIIFQNAAARGLPVFFSTGDNGAFECNPNGTPTNLGFSSFPASDPLVTAVGATALDRNTSNNTWQNETAWSCTAGNDPGCLQANSGSSSGGAASTRNPALYPRPAYQDSVNPPVEAKFTNPATNTRLQPDISTNGAPASGQIIYIVSNPGTPNSCTDCYLGGGTSASAPFLAGIAALAVQKKGGPVGGLNSFIYKNFSTAWAYDVTDGYTGVSARVGWDYTTGKGSIKDVTAFLNAFVIPAPFLTGSLEPIIELAGNGNGVVDPGETIGLKITLTNTGNLAATGISGTLSLTGGTANLTGATSGYPNIAPKSSAANSVNYVFSTVYTQTCGDTLNFRLAVTYNSNLSYVYNFSLKIGTGQVTSYTSSSPAAIPDNDAVGLNSTMNVLAGFKAADVNVTVNINHTWDGDLTLKLVAPDSTSVLLSNRQGSNGKNYTGTVFDSQAATSIVTGVPPYTGSFQPEQSLDALNNKPVTGNWTLNVADLASSDTGTLVGWSLTFQSTYSCTVYNPVPVLTALSQTSVLRGSAGLTLTLSGTNFFNGASLLWNGKARPVTFINSGQLTAQIPASDLSTAGYFPVAVLNPAPSGGTSGSLQFTVNNPQPAISGLLPVGTSAGGDNFKLTVNGSDFVNGASILWNGTARPTTFVNGGQLTALISGSDIAASGTVQVAVRNPAPRVADAAAKPFNITNTTPFLTGIFPDKLTAGGPSFTLTINGLNFVAGSIVYWNSSAIQGITTTYINHRMVTISLPANYIASAGTPSITVVNPQTGNTQSNSQTLTITSGCQPLVVTKTDANSNDTTTCGYLRYALLQSAASRGTVNLALNAGQTITLANQANKPLTIPAGVSINGVCSPTGPALTIAGASTANSLVLGNGNAIFGLKFSGFGNAGKPQLKVLANGNGANRLTCSKISKT